MNFEEKFALWLEKSLNESIPEEVKGFSFNLFEPADMPGVKFGIELIGAESFDEEDSDWACDEIWEPSTRQLPIPVDYSSDTWEVCLNRMKEFIVRYLESNTDATNKLKKVDGIGLGFVDGDLEIIWKA